jgi:hypothetical protein
MKLRAIFVWFVISILLPSCNQRQLKPAFDCSGFQVGKDILLVDSLAKGIISYRDYIYVFAKHLNIPDIVPGENDSTLRVWFWQGDTVFVLNLEKHGTAGLGYLISFTESTPASKHALTITNCLVTPPPIHGRTKLFKTLVSDDVPLIPDGKPNDQLRYGMTSGGRIYIEFQQGKQYRFYSYLEPGYFQFVDSNAGKLHHFLVYLQNELPLKVYEDLTGFAETPIRTGKTISQAEYRFMRNNKFIDSGENVLQIYGDFSSYTAILTDKRIGDYFPRAINLGDSFYQFALIPTVRQVNLNFSSWSTDTFKVMRWDGSNFTLRLGGSRQQLMDFFDSADVLLRRTRKLRRHS